MSAAKYLAKIVKPHIGPRMVLGYLFLDLRLGMVLVEDSPLNLGAQNYYNSEAFLVLHCILAISDYL